MRSAIFSCLLFALFGSVQAFGRHTVTSRTCSGVQSKVVASRGGYQVLRGGNIAAPSLWGRYLHALETRPMPTKLVTAAVLSGTGDIIAQAMEASAPFAVKRLLTLVAVNVFYIVPILSAFYAANEALARYLKLEQAAQWKRTAVQLGFDQLVNAPIVVGGFFCAFQLATAVADALTVGFPGAGALLASMREQLTSSWASTVVTNWQVWVIPQLVNFAFIPPWGRVAFANVIALVWNVILSVIANE